MYPYDIFPELDLYSLLMVVGVVICLLFIRLQSDRRGLPARLQNLMLAGTVAAIVVGYGAAVLTQAFYNYLANGTFEVVANTGATFYGGLIGGAGVFILLYFVAGRLLFPDGKHIPLFRDVSDIAAACITVAHGFGRRGCLMVGCCYGARTDYVTQAQHVFEELRTADDLGMRVVYVSCPKAEGVGLAVYNRLLRACAFKVKEI